MTIRPVNAPLTLAQIVEQAVYDFWSGTYTPAREAGMVMDETRHQMKRRGMRPRRIIAQVLSNMQLVVTVFMNDNPAEVFTFGAPPVADCDDATIIDVVSDRTTVQDLGFDHAPTMWLGNKET